MTLLNQITYYISRLAAFRISKRGLALTGLIVVMGMYAHSSDAATISRPMQSLGLVGYWSFDVGKGGAKAVDMSGRGNNGTLTNMNTTAAWVGGKIGQALNFDGSNDFVNAGSATILDDMGPLTWSAWIYPRGFGEANEAYIIGKGTNASFGANYTVFHLIPGDSYSFEFLVHYKFDTFSIPILRRSAANAITLNKWQYVAVTWDGSTDSTQIKLFVNGAETSYSISQTPIGSRQSDAAKNVLIGNDSTSGDRTFDGLIDEVRIYNRALSATEIKRLYRQTSPQMNASQANKLRQGLVGMWTFDGNDMSGNTAIDRSGNGNNGTLTNGPKKAIGKIGQALSFDGSNDFGDLGTPAIFDLDASYSLSAWVYTTKPSGGSNFNQTIIALGSGACCGTERLLDLAWDSGGGTYRFRYAHGGSTVLSGTQTPQLNRWYHVAGTWDGTTRRFYMDGVLDGTQSFSTAPTEFSANNYIGSSFGTASFWQGLIDEARVYNRALTPAEIRQLYKAGSSFHPNVTNKSTIRDGLVGHWSFDGADMGTTSARDASGNANTGWLINGTQKAIGRIGQALNFDGSNDYVNAGSAAALDNLSQISVSAWVFPRTFGGNGNNDGVIISKSNTSINVGGWGIQLTGSTGSPCTVVNFKFAVDYDVQDLRRDTNFGSITCGVWQHVVATWDGSANTSGIRLYINGVETSYGSEWSGVTSRVSDAAYPMRIGNSGLGNDTWGGIIDEVRVYNRALSPDEVKRLYNMGR